MLFSVITQLINKTTLFLLLIITDKYSKLNYRFIFYKQFFSFEVTQMINTRCRIILQDAKNTRYSILFH